MPPLGSLGGLDDTPHGVLRSTCAEYQTHILCQWSSPGKRRGRRGSGDLERPRPDQTRPDQASTAVCVQSAQKTSSARWPAHAACFPPAPPPTTGQAQPEPTARGLTAGCPTSPQKNHQEGRAQLLPNLSDPGLEEEDSIIVGTCPDPGPTHRKSTCLRATSRELAITSAKTKLLRSPQEGTRR